MAAKQGVVAINLDKMKMLCGANWTTLGDPCHDDGSAATFLRFADLVWPGGWEPLIFRRDNVSRNYSFRDTKLVVYTMTERSIRRGVRFASAFNFESYTLYYSSHLLGLKKAAHLIESFSIVFSPLDVYWWTSLASLFIISGLSYFLAALRRQPEGFLASHSRHLLAFATALFTFIYAQAAKAEAMTLQPSVAPFTDLHELETLLRQGRMQLLFPFVRSSVFGLVNRSESGPLKRLADTFKVTPPMFLDGGSVNRKLHTHPHLVAVALASLQSATSVSLNAQCALRFVLYAQASVQIDTSCMKEAVGFAGYFPDGWGSFELRRNATRKLMERAAWASTTLRHFEQVWRHRHALNAEFSGLLCPKLRPAEAYKPIGLLWLLQLSTAYVTLFLPIQTAALVAELCFSCSKGRSFPLHAMTV